MSVLYYTNRSAMSAASNEPSPHSQPPRPSHFCLLSSRASNHVTFSLYCLLLLLVSCSSAPFLECFVLVCAIFIFRTPYWIIYPPFFFSFSFLTAAIVFIFSLNHCVVIGTQISDKSLSWHVTPTVAADSGINQRDICWMQSCKLFST